MRKLDHRHVVKVVATYTPRPHELCLLIWPAAVCNLAMLLNDIDMLRCGEQDRDDIIERLDALDLKDLSAIEVSSVAQNIESSTKCPLEYLRNIIGCVARGMAHCHANDLRHLDIKPSNVLLKAERVYLADFGISRDVSGQDQTTTDGLPGTEKWRAPELYAGQSSSMKLSDIYSLGLVYLNIAAVLYNVRLAEFDEALQYSPMYGRREQLTIREAKLNDLLAKLTSHALVTPPFMFTYEGQETVRPRPLVHLASKMISINPRDRPTADKVDDKLSMLGGIYQIYHAGCCKRPMSWVEDKWDRKFTSIINLRRKNEHLQTRVDELEGRDETYEARLENARRTHENDVARLQLLLKESEEKCRKLEQSQGGRKKSFGREQHPRPNPTFIKQQNNTMQTSSPIGLGLTKTRSIPTAIPVRPVLPQTHHSSPRYYSDSTRTPPARPAIPSPRQSTGRIASGSPAQRTPSITNLTGYTLRSVGSGSKLPLPVTPNSRSGTPNLTRDQSMTDSSMASSVFSRQSLESAPTPAQSTPALDKNTQGQGQDDKPNPQWGELPAGNSPARRRRRPSTPTAPLSPVMSMSPSAMSSAMSSPKTTRSELFSGDDDDPNATCRPRIPSLQTMKSWADVASKRLR